MSAPPRALKRFWQSVAVAPEAEGFAVKLDRATLKTPLGQPAVVPNIRLARALADEMEAAAPQPGDPLRLERLPLQRLVATALDRLAQPSDRAAVVEAALAYAGSELVCQRAHHPQDLVARQRALWDPLLAWFAAETGAALRPVEGLAAQRQDAGALARAATTLGTLDPWRLTVFQAALATTQSFVIALALVAGRLAAAEAFAAAELEETYQIELWGEDEEAALRRADMRADLHACERLLALLRA